MTAAIRSAMHTPLTLSELAQRLDLRLLQAHKRLALAVSGGRDSMALLALVAFLLKEQLLSIEVVVFHLNHRLRPDSGEDLELVRRAAAQFDLPFYFEEWDVARFAARSKLNLEAAGRRLRYRALGRLLRLLGGGAAVTGHHADDYAESVLLHLTRGAGVAALSTMPQASTVEDVRVLRPLMTFRAEELRSIAGQARLAFNEDPSNADRKFRRNRLRHEVLPTLREFGFDAARLWRNVHASEGPARGARPPADVEPTARPQVVSLDRRLLLPLDSRQTKRVLDSALLALGLAPAGARLVGELSACVGERPYDFAFRWKSAELWIWSNRRGPLWFFARDSAFLRSPTFEPQGSDWVVSWAGRTVRLAASPELRPSVFLPGLRIRLADGHTQKLKQFFQEQGLPGPVRATLPLFLDRRTGLVARICTSFWEHGRDRLFPSEPERS